MMTGNGPFGAVGMGGSSASSRCQGPVAGDYKDPAGHAYRWHVAFEWTARCPSPRASRPTQWLDATVAKPATPAEVRVRKPNGHSGHSGH